MTAGQIVAVDWRDAIAGSWEPNKRRPGIIVSSEEFFAGNLPFEIVVPLTGQSHLALPWASTLIRPTPQNGCSKQCYALAWNVQSVPHARLTATRSRISEDELHQIRAQIVSCSS
jgi:mRNA-degrading endonuclease toxin of MazEF toxin-antitoxin module